MLWTHVAVTSTGCGREQALYRFIPAWAPHSQLVWCIHSHRLMAEVSGIKKKKRGMCVWNLKTILIYTVGGGVINNHFHRGGAVLRRGWAVVREQGVPFFFTDNILHQEQESRNRSEIQSPTSIIF